MAQQDATQHLNDIVQQIVKTIASLRFGSVEIVIHEGRITQIEKREKLRFNTSN